MSEMQSAGALRLLSGLWLTAFALLPACERNAVAPSPGEEPVHIVIYLIDTLRRDRLGVYGYPRPTSPNIDALARDAVVFDNAYAPAPWTLPSIASLMTATYPVDHGVLFLGQQIGEGLSTLPERLGELGFATGGFVVNPTAEASGIRRGYDHFGVKAGPLFVGRWLRGVGAGPFFLYVHTAEPHAPFRPPAELVQRFGRVQPALHQRITRDTELLLDLLRADRDAGLAPGTRDNSDQQDTARQRLSRDRKAIDVLYDASVAWADANLGQIISLLKEMGFWERTLLIVTSDHGEEFFEHRGVGHSQSLYAELVRIPMIWRFPANQAGGIRVDAPVTLVDVMPTILDYLGRRDLTENDIGRSFLDLLKQPDAGAPEEPVVTSVRINRRNYYRPAKEQRGDFNVSVVEGRWKGIWNIEPDSFELFDTEADPGERRDVASEHREVANRLQQATVEWLHARPELDAGQGSTGDDRLDHLSPETLDRLRALGYVD
ncbi:MAG: sulfatase [Proteobacteria bacterium]|nr:sulfatase [Pseudomonadota bacterium]